MGQVFGVAPKVSSNSSGGTSAQNPKPKPNPSAANKSAVDKSTAKLEYRPANRQPPSLEPRLPTRDDLVRANAHNMAKMFLSVASKAMESIKANSQKPQPNPNPGAGGDSTIGLQLSVLPRQPAPPKPAEGASSRDSQPVVQRPCDPRAALEQVIVWLRIAVELLQPQSSGGSQFTRGPSNDGTSPENNQPVGHSPRAPGADPPVSEEVLSAARALMQLRYSGGQQPTGSSNHEDTSSGNPGATSTTRKRPREASPSVGERRPRVPHHVMVAAQQKELDTCNARVGQGPRASEHEGEERASKRQKREKRKKRDDEDEAPKEDQE